MARIDTIAKLNLALHIGILMKTQISNLVRTTQQDMSILSVLSARKCDEMWQYNLQRATYFILLLEYPTPTKLTVMINLKQYWKFRHTSISVLPSEIQLLEGNCRESLNRFTPAILLCLSQINFQRNISQSFVRSII